MVKLKLPKKVPKPPRVKCRCKKNWASKTATRAPTSRT